MDAVATLLRRQERFFIAEDSFLVQFKSRSETVVEFHEGRFKALTGQDLPLFVGHVDLRAGSLELHSLGVALAHPNIYDISGLVAHLQSSDDKAGFVDGALHVVLNKPILRMTISDAESPEFTNNAYEVLKAWLTWERWNRRYRRSGIARQIVWETNQVPRENGTSYLWNPERAREALDDFVPFMPILVVAAGSNAELRSPALEIMAWLRSHGVEPDPGGIWATTIDHAEADDRLRKALDAHPEADIACTFRIYGAREDQLDFWLVSRSRAGTSSEERHTGNIALIREKGFVASVESVNAQVRIVLGLSDEWLSRRYLEPAPIPSVCVRSALKSQIEDVLLLRKAPKADGSI